MGFTGKLHHISLQINMPRAVLIEVRMQQIKGHGHLDIYKPHDCSYLNIASKQWDIVPHQFINLFAQVCSDQNYDAQNTHV